jgi:hypothetical protein
MKLCSTLSEIEFLSNRNYKDYIKNCKKTYKEFIYEQTFVLMGYPVFILFKDDFEKSFNKYTKGDPKFHNQTKNYDLDRLGKIKWIFDLLKNYSNCQNSEICNSYIFSLYKHNEEDCAALFCETHKYGIFFRDKTRSKRPHFLLTSAYTVKRNYMINKILNGNINRAD